MTFCKYIPTDSPMINSSNFQVKSINVMCYRNMTYSMFQNIKCYTEYKPQWGITRKTVVHPKGLLFSVQIQAYLNVPIF